MPKESPTDLAAAAAAPSTTVSRDRKKRQTKQETEASYNASKRLTSLDALRGFDMFWIVGGAQLVRSLSEYMDWGWLQVVAAQTHHVEWHGFTFWDLIFPLFLFISGVTMPYSLTKRIERGERKSNLYWRVFRRGMALVLLGMIYNGLLDFNWDSMRYPSVLGRIGLAYLFGALIVMNTDVRGQIKWMIGIMLGYWAAMTLIPVPGVGAGVLTMEGNLASYIDRMILPGELYRDIHDPEGLVSTIPAVATALLGALAGYVLRSYNTDQLRKAGLIATGGIACLGLALVWDPFFPINKNLWTSSFVLYAGGWSLLLLATFYLVIDVWNIKKWSFFFVVIGLNPITIYMAAGGIIDFRYTADFFFGGLVSLAGQPLQTVLIALGIIAVEWVFLYVLYRKRIFLKV